MGADPNKGYRNTDKDGDVYVTTPLHIAATRGFTEVVRSLLESKADPNMGNRRTDKDGNVTVETPLIMAAGRGYTEVVTSLLERGARLDLDTGGENLADHHYHYCQAQLCHHHHQQACQRTGIRKNLLPTSSSLSSPL